LSLNGVKLSIRERTDSGLLIGGTADVSAMPWPTIARNAAMCGNNPLAVEGGSPYVFWWLSSVER
jgi:hypothetical protein